MRRSSADPTSCLKSVGTDSRLTCNDECGQGLENLDGWTWLSLNSTCIQTPGMEWTTFLIVARNHQHVSAQMNIVQYSSSQKVALTLTLFSRMNAEITWNGRCALCPYLHSQAHGVEHDEKEHQVFKVAGGDDVPDLILERVLGNITPQWPGLESVLHTLALDNFKKMSANARFAQSTYTSSLAGVMLKPWGRSTVPFNTVSADV